MGHGGDAEGDVLSTVENLTGSAHNDVFWGDSGKNVINGAGGDDTYHYSTGQGDDTFSGGTGSDMIELDGISSSPGNGAWTLNLSNGATYTLDAVNHTLDFSGSASGTINIPGAGGGTLSFDGVEKISWG